VGWEVAVVDPAKQIEVLAELRERRLVTEDEFEWQRAKALARY
jgi:hypothetical protein